MDKSYRSLKLSNDSHDLTKFTTSIALETPLISRNGWHPQLQRREVFEYIKKQFRTSARCHGALNDRVVLWGISGSGKRLLATQVAQEIAVEYKRKILWVEGRSFEAFMRDYRQAFITLTGTTLPTGIDRATFLANIKHTLEQRRQEWIMVIVDLQSFLENNTGNDFGHAMTAFLPERGQILITTACAVVEQDADSKFDPQLVCGLDIAVNATQIHLQSFSDNEVRHLAKAASLDCHKLDFRAFRPSGLRATPPLRFTIACASILLLRISTAQYFSLFKVKAGQLESRQGDAFTNFNVAFAVTMEIIWDALADHNAWAQKLLASLSVVDRLRIPVALVEQLPMFKDEASDVLSPAMSLLCSTGLAELQEDTVCGATLNVHLLTYRWVRVKVQEVFEKAEFADLLRGWVDVLHGYLRTSEDDDIEQDPPAGYDRSRCWTLAAHIWPLVSCVTTQRIFQRRALSFVSEICAWLVEDSLLPNYAALFSNQALFMSQFMESIRPEIVTWYDKIIIQLRLIRCRALMQLNKPTEAAAEVLEAKRRFSLLKTEEKTIERKRQIHEWDIQVLIAQERYAEAERILDTMLYDPEEGLQSMVQARRHYLMAICLSAQDLYTAALQHSHMTMRYWQTLTPNEQWGYQDVMPLRWIDKHANLLLSMAKYKGVLAFLPDLYKRWNEIIPERSVISWRLAYCMEYCYGALDRLDEAEKLALDILERSPIEHFIHESDTMAYALQMLRGIAVSLMQVGRLVEGEGVCRYIITTSRERDVRNLNGDEKYHRHFDLVQLVTCLLKQGKGEEAQRVRELKWLPEFDEEYFDDVVQAAMTNNRYVIEIYEMALEAERSKMTKEWRSLLTNVQVRDLMRAVKRFGSPSRRIKEGQDFASDIDLHHVSQARRSRILHLLDRNLVYLAFSGRYLPLLSIDTLPDGQIQINEVGPTEELWCDRKQRVLGEFWKWCECRRSRERSGSINPVDLIEKRTIRKRDAEDMAAKAKAKKQRNITDWVTRGQDSSKTAIKCHIPNCPCIAANDVAVAHTAALEETLFLSKAKVEKNSRVSKRHRYRNQKSNAGAVPINEIFTFDNNGGMRWMQSELSTGEGEDENYIIPHAIEIPSVIITAPAGEDLDIEEVKDQQTSLTKFFPSKTIPSTDKNLLYGNWYHHPTRLDDILEDDEEDE